MATSARIELHGPENSRFDPVLTPDALEFVAALQAEFGDRRRQLLSAREERRARLAQGELLDFLSPTESVRAGDWRVAAVPQDLQQRWVEITGPTERKMVINALNSGANVFMADFEDSNSPTWDNNLSGQINMRDAARGDITYASPEGKKYALNPKHAVLLVRPRGWHLEERHMSIGDLPMSGSLMDFGLYFFHNVKTCMAKGTAPYFYLPKLQSHLEARLWNDVFVYAQQYAGVPNGTIRATVLIETILAAFEMDEILWELRDHSAGLNCGRWDYIFSFIKTFKNHPRFMMPDRSTVTMEKDFLKSYVDLLIHTCHRRGIHAMGGMAAQIPIRNDAAANDAALNKVRQDKLREVRAGHDGTWVAHPGLVPIAKEIFDEHMHTPNQLHVMRDEVQVTAADLLKIPEGQITEQGLRMNVDVGVQYLESWLRGSGCVPIYNLMEDAATAEISRTQVWQWMHHGALLSNGQKITAPMIRSTIKSVIEQIRTSVGAERYDKSKFPQAAQIFEQMMIHPECKEFLTLEAYRYL
ncbi:MAG TPA: malate synthase A [Bryobacteraceae bacterium]